MQSVIAGLLLLGLLPAAAAKWIPAAPPDTYGWALTTEDPDLPTGIFETVTYVDCGANITSALSLNVFAIATLSNITGSNLRILVHTTRDGVEASVKLTDASGRVTASTVSSALAAEQCPDITVDLPLNRALVYTLTIEVEEPAGYSTLGPQPHFNLVAVGIDQDSAEPQSSEIPTTGTSAESQYLTATTSKASAPSAVGTHSSHINVALIAGPIAGAMLLIVIILLVLLLRAKRQRTQRKSWVSDINGEGAYEASSIGVSDARHWSTYGNMSMAASVGPPLATSVPYSRSSLAVQSHPSVTDLTRTSYLGQPSVASPLCHSEISTVASTTRPLSGYSVAVEPPNGTFQLDAGASSKAQEGIGYDAPPAYIPPETSSAPLQSKD